MPAIVRGYEWVHMTTALRRTAERRNKRIRWPISPTEKSAKLTPFRVIAPLDEKCTAYLAKKLTFATPGPAPGYWASQLARPAPRLRGGGPWAGCAAAPAGGAWSRGVRGCLPGGHPGARPGAEHGAEPPVQDL